MKTVFSMCPGITSPWLWWLIGVSVCPSPAGRGYGVGFILRQGEVERWIHRFGGLDLGKNWLLYYSSVVQELNGFFILAMFPYQWEEPNSAFANPEIGGRESHAWVYGFLVALGSVFWLPTEDFSLPVSAKGMKVIRKCLYFLQIRDSYSLPPIRLQLLVPLSLVAKRALIFFWTWFRLE